MHDRIEIVRFLKLLQEIARLGSQHLELRIQEDMKTALKGGRKEELSAIRMIRAQLKDARIDKGGDLTEQEVEVILLKSAKKRKESIEIYLSGNRPDLAAKEEFELGVVNKYLPQQMSEEELRDLISQVVKEQNLTSEKDMGRLMGVLMPQVKGKADGSLVQKLAREVLLNLSS